MIDVAKTTLDDIRLKEKTMEQAISAGDMKIDGRREAFTDFMSLLDAFPFWFNIVTPPAAACSAPWRPARRMGEAVVSLDEPTGAIAPDAKQDVIGHAAIRATVSGFLARKPRLSLHDSEVVHTGDIAFVRSHWTVPTVDPSGKEPDMSVESTLVACRNGDGRWLAAIDRPLPISR